MGGGMGWSTMGGGCEGREEVISNDWEKAEMLLGAMIIRA